ncbi:uncharacterized protein LOC106177863 [Lingula anatina]|uniref:Uncharacterized protein LOC106177863 n=1 Tax=Lingula anatina TaxID=7574 RepID=A0A1S3K0Q7_LINAN|nr:uncharacterized protein LOC106177863 [Lingula anatina]|eukprot:XP_013416225.1 uncharacterized protein LOC106177863 [Lingula anatina]
MHSLTSKLLLLFAVFTWRADVLVVQCLDLQTELERLKAIAQALLAASMSQSEAGASTPSENVTTPGPGLMQTMNICDGHQETLRCDEGFAIKINDAFYGRDDEACVPSNSSNLENCGAPGVASALIGKYCQNSGNECTIAALPSAVTNLTAGDFGNCTMGDPLYLRVNYTCEPVPTGNPGIPSCTTEHEGYIPNGILLKDGVQMEECKQQCDSIASCMAVSYFTNGGVCNMHTADTACGSLVMSAGALHYKRIICGDSIPSSFESALIGARSYGGIKVANQTCPEPCLRACEAIPECRAVGFDLNTRECHMYTSPMEACGTTYVASHWAFYKGRNCPRVAGTPPGCTPAQP